MNFLNELHKNTRIKIRLCIALLLLFVDTFNIAYLAYVIITEIFRFMSRRKNLEFLNSIIMKIILIMLLSGIMDFFFNKDPEEPAWAKIMAYIIIAIIIEQPFKLFVMLRGDKRRSEREFSYYADDEQIEDEREFGIKTENTRESEQSKSFKLSFTLKNNKKRQKSAQYSGHPGTSSRIQYKVSSCSSCGFKNKIIAGEVENCEYCGSPID